MCFKRNKVNYYALSKELYDNTRKKLNDFKEYLKENDFKGKGYQFLLDTKWFKEIDFDCTIILNGLSYQLVDPFDETTEDDYKYVKETCEKINWRINNAKVSVPDTINLMKENEKEFLDFCKTQYCRFFVIEDLFTRKKELCFSVEKEMLKEEKFDDHGFLHLKVVLTDTDNKFGYIKDVSATDYKIRKMTEDEFLTEFLPYRCEKIGFSNEIELKNYEEEMQHLFIEDGLTLKKK